jgi:bifunctional DNase/RNase
MIVRIGGAVRNRRYHRGMADLIEMTVDSIRVHMPTGQHVVILKEKTAERYLPIWIGINEANAIALKITGMTPERPITHDLLANILGAVDVNVDRIVVTSLANEVFYARILAQVDGRRMEIDSRPSDAIAVAVRVGAGIFVATEVLDRAGVLPDADQEAELGETDEETTERLAKIRDWVNELNLPDLGGDSPLSQS